jgi:GNAT superfamily N-acetyltransferase
LRIEHAEEEGHWRFAAHHGSEAAGTLLLASREAERAITQIVEVRAESLAVTDALLQHALRKARDSGGRMLFIELAQKQAALGPAFVAAGFDTGREIRRYTCCQADRRLWRRLVLRRWDELDHVAQRELLAATATDSMDRQIAQCRDQLGPEEDAISTLRLLRGLSHKSAWWEVAWDGKREPVGVVLPVVHARRPTIGFLGVKPRYRGQGLGRALLARAVHSFRKSDYFTACAEADLENVPMQRAVEASKS